MARASTVFATNGGDVSDPDLRMAILREMAAIRHELSGLNDPRKPPLGPTEFTRRYTQQLKERLAQLEQELHDIEGEDAAD